MKNVRFFFSGDTCKQSVKYNIICSMSSYIVHVHVHEMEELLETQMLTVSRNTLQMLKAFLT